MYFKRITKKVFKFFFKFCFISEKKKQYYTRMSNGIYMVSAQKPTSVTHSVLGICY